MNSYTQSLLLQSILYFVLAQIIDGKTRSEAVRDFIGSLMCKAWGNNLTFANVHGFATAAGYPE